MKAALPAYSEAIGEFFIVPRGGGGGGGGEEEDEEDEEDHVPGLGMRMGSTLLFSTTVWFCYIKLRRNCSF